MLVAVWGAGVLGDGLMVLVLISVLSLFERRKGRWRLVWTERQRLREVVMVFSSHLRGGQVWEAVLLSSFGRGRRAELGEGRELREEEAALCR